MRMICPSLDGLTPRSESRIAFSMALSEPWSYGLMITIRASGMLIEASWLIGVMRAVVVDGDAANMFGVPDRCGALARSSLATATALLHLLLGVEERLVDHGVCPSLVPRRSGVLTSVPILSPRTARAMLPSVKQVEHDDRHLVVHAEAERRRVGDLEPLPSTSR